jgi:glycosyltransferase involved in cell wall biosynthesis
MRDADVVVLLTTWNRSSLLRRSLPQIQRETARIGARLVVSDDRSSDHEVLTLLATARDAGVDVIERPPHDHADCRVDELVHAAPREAVRRLVTSPEGAELISRCARRGDGSAAVREALRALWDARRGDAYASTQENNLLGFRHVLANYPRAAWILKVDDDVILRDGAFEHMLATWDRAEQAGHDILAVSGLRTVNEALRHEFTGYGVTVGVCNVAVLYRRVDWERFLRAIPERKVIEKGFDLAFAWDYGPRYRPGAVAICVMPSVVYHAGDNGVNVRNADVNCDFEWGTDVSFEV